MEGERRRERDIVNQFKSYKKMWRPQASNGYRRKRATQAKALSYKKWRQRAMATTTDTDAHGDVKMDEEEVAIEGEEEHEGASVLATL